MSFKPGKRLSSLLLVALFSIVASMVLAACGDPTATTAPATTKPATTAAATTAAAASTVASAATTAAAPAATVTTGAAAAVKTVAPVPNGNKTGVTDTEIKVGNFSPQTGGAAAYGVIARVVDAYFKETNAAGGINGRQLKLIYEDDSYTAAKSQVIVKKLVEQEKVFALVGGVGTAINLSIRDYLKDNSVPHIGFFTGSSALVNPPRKDQFGMLPTYPFEAETLATFAAENLGSKKVAILYQNDGFGKDGQQAFVKVAPSKGLQIVAEVTYETGATDMSSQALRLQQSGADTVYIMAVPGPGATLMKEMDKLGYKPKSLLTFVLNDAQFYSTAGKAADGIYTTNFTPLPDSDDPKVVKFREFMKKNLPQEQVGAFAMWGYLAAQAFTEGVRRAGKDLSRESFVAAMESIVDWKDSIAPTLSYGPDNRGPVKSLYVMQYKDQKFAKVSELFTQK